MEIRLEHSLLAPNEAEAETNRSLLRQKGLRALNLMGSPGAGKTALLEAALRLWAGRLRVGIIEGDVATELDARRVSDLGAYAVQINTAGACHLDARMVGRAIRRLPLEELDLVVVENVGNLVCPADYRLGEEIRITVLSTAEGEDKVRKYPAAFRSADAVILNKIDLLEHTDFNMERFRESLREVCPEAVLFQVSARTGRGVEQWANWLTERLR